MQSAETLQARRLLAVHQSPPHLEVETIDGSKRTIPLAAELADEAALLVGEPVILCLVAGVVVDLASPDDAGEWVRGPDGKFRRVW